MCTKYTASDYSTYLTFCQSYTRSVKCIEQLIVFCTNSKSFIIILCSITTSKCKNVVKFCVHISPIFSCLVTNNDRCRVSLISLFSLSFPSYHPWFSSEFCDARGSGLSVALSLFNFSCVEFHPFYHSSQPFIFFNFFYCNNLKHIQHGCTNQVNIQHCTSFNVVHHPQASPCKIRSAGSPFEYQQQQPAALKSVLVMQE